MKRPKHLNHYKDCRNKWRCYLKRPREPQIPLPLPIGSEAFWSAYNKALGGKASAVDPGSLSAPILEHYQSAEFKVLADSTPALHGALRKSDAVRLGRQHLRDGCHVIGTRKSGEMVTLEIPLHKTLAQHLKHAPDHLVYIVTEHGKPRSSKAFTAWISEAARKAGLPPNTSPHGLQEGRLQATGGGGMHPPSDHGDHGPPEPCRGRALHQGGQPESVGEGSHGDDHTRLPMRPDHERIS